MIAAKGQGRTKRPASVNGDVPRASPHFNPKQLLNPKGFRKPPEDHEKSDAARPEHGADVKDAPGLGTLIERIHNVSSRVDVPRKKQKMEHRSENDQEQKKAVFAGGGKSGVIGDYMKGQREEGMRTGGPTTTTVDLTTGMMIDCINSVTLMGANCV